MDHYQWLDDSLWCAKHGIEMVDWCQWCEIAYEARNIVGEPCRHEVVEVSRVIMEDHSIFLVHQCWDCDRVRVKFWSYNGLHRLVDDEDWTRWLVSR